jgi:hypothetical protein
VRRIHPGDLIDIACGILAGRQYLYTDPVSRETPMPGSSVDRGGMMLVLAVVSGRPMRSDKEEIDHWALVLGSGGAIGWLPVLWLEEAEA